MIDQVREISRLRDQPTVYRRHLQKTDGRDLFLYGYEAHTLPRVPGTDLERVLGSELRHHPLRGDWSIYAAARQNRTYKPGAAHNPLAPSRPGEPLTEIPFENFDMAVFANRFPGLHNAVETPSHGLTKTAAAKGRCEVVVYAPASEGSLATLGQDRRRLLIETWIDRYRDHFEDGAAFVLPFENRGEDVGVTLHHPHGQIYGFPFVPGPQAEAARAFESGYDLARDVENWGPAHTISEAGGIVCYAPPYARFPYEVWLSARKPVSGPWAMDSEQTDGFAQLLGETIGRYDAFFEQETPYMLSLHAAPFGRDGTFQFTAQFYPLLRAPSRLKYLASVEQATGVFTVDVMPEQTAARLKATSC